MNKKIKSSAIEFDLLYKGISLVRSNMLYKKMIALKKGIIIPDNLINEMENYTKRNILKPCNESEIFDFCPACFKAHLIKKGKEMELDKKAIKYLENEFYGLIGHNGYYIDEDNLIQV